MLHAVYRVGERALLHSHTAQAAACMQRTKAHKTTMCL